MTTSADNDNWYSDDTATFGDRLAAAREQSGLNQRQLADRLGVKTATIIAWEDDRKEPRANRLTMLSGILGISLSWLMTGTGEGPDTPDDADNGDRLSVVDLLAQMRAVRAEIAAANDRLARLEKQLRTAMVETP